MSNGVLNITTQYHNKNCLELLYNIGANYNYMFRTRDDLNFLDFSDDKKIRPMSFTISKDLRTYYNNRKFYHQILIHLYELFCIRNEMIFKIMIYIEYSCKLNRLFIITMKDMCTSAIHEFGILTKKDNLMK